MCCFQTHMPRNLSDQQQIVATADAIRETRVAQDIRGEPYLCIGPSSTSNQLNRTGREPFA
jgi:hypothetical protein